MIEWSDPALWAHASDGLRQFRVAGLERLMTEDTVRFATGQALVQQGVDPRQLWVERPHPTIKGARIDLVVGDPPLALVELKFPREPNEKNAAWTMTLGEVLKDFYRLATYPGDRQRIFVYVESVRLRRYMLGAADRFGVDIDRSDVHLRPEQIMKLPTTAREIIGPQAVLPVAARRTNVIDIDEKLRLSVYAVDAVADPAASIAAAAPAAADRVHAPEAYEQRHRPDPQPRGGARAEILSAIDRLLVRSGANSVTVEEVLFELRRRGTTYADSTIRTMMTSHMCANAPDHNAVTWDDLERVGRGVYRRL